MANRRQLTRALIACAVGAGVLLSGVAGLDSAEAELRTGSSVLAGEESATSARFPGLASVGVRYEDVTGALDVTAKLRSPLADPAQSSALRSTRIEMNLGTFFGGDIAWACDDVLEGLTLYAKLGQGIGGVDLGEYLEPKDDVVVPLEVAADRLSVKMSFAANERLAGRNLICSRATLLGPEGYGNDAEFDMTRSRLLDGFSGTDGDIGIYAENNLRAEFRYLHNEFVPRSGDAIFDDPGWDVACGPKARVVVVDCHARGVIRSIAGRPTVRVTGDLSYGLTRSREPDGEMRVRWTPRLRVSVRFKRCPRRVDRSRARRRLGCEVKWRWRTSEGDLRDAFLRRVGLPSRRLR